MYLFARTHSDILWMISRKLTRLDQTVLTIVCGKHTPVHKLTPYELASLPKEQFKYAYTRVCCKPKPKTLLKKIFAFASNLIYDDEEIKTRTVINKIYICAAYKGRIDLVRLCMRWGASWNTWAAAWAARMGHIEIVKLCRTRYADENFVMAYAARGGHVAIVELCKEWGAISVNFAMVNAAYGGHMKIVKLCKDWGANNFDAAIASAMKDGHIEIAKLCKTWRRAALTGR